MSSVGVRMLNYLLTPILSYLMSDARGVADYGVYSLVYACIAFANIVFTYGFETGFFRYSNKEGIDKEQLFQTTFGSLLVSSIVLSTGIGLFSSEISNFLDFANHPEYILLALGIISLDAISTIPFAKLRQDGRPKKYAFVKLGGVLLNIVLVLLFLAFLPQYYTSHPNAWGSEWFYGQDRISLLLWANLIMNFFVFTMLFREWKTFRFKLDTALWKTVFQYASPMVFIGLAGMTNEVLDRLMLQKLLPTSDEAAKMIVGVYSANYKLAIFITLFIQAFKMAAEPFFFKEAQDKNAPQLYARVMKWFVFTLCIAFLFTTLFIDVWKYFIAPNYRSGLGVVPILLMANICLGIYYNLSVWYKITDKMRAGVYITLLGAAITITGNYYLIPLYGMYATAWVTFACYFTMVMVSYLAGQKYFAVPYPLKAILKIVLLMLAFYILHYGVRSWVLPNTDLTTGVFISIATGITLLLAYVLIIYSWYKDELGNISLKKMLKR